MTAYGAILGSPSYGRHIGQPAEFARSWAVLRGHGAQSVDQDRPQLPAGRQDGRYAAVRRARKSPLPSYGIAGYGPVTGRLVAPRLDQGIAGKVYGRADEDRSPKQEPDGARHAGGPM